MLVILLGHIISFISLRQMANLTGTTYSFNILNDDIWYFLLPKLHASGPTFTTWHVTCVTLRRRVLMFWKTPTYMKINAILLQTAWRRCILWYLFSLLRDFLWCKILFLLFLWKSFGCPWKDAVICKLKSFLCTLWYRIAVMH